MAIPSCSCLENPRDRGTWWAAVYGVAQSPTQLKQFSSSTQLKIYIGIPRFIALYCGASPDGSDGKESTCNAGDLGSIPGLGRSPGGGHGNPPQYSCLENLHGQRSLVGYSPWGCKESDKTEPLSIAQDCTVQIMHFCRFKVCDNLASSKSVSTIFPTAFTHFVSAHFGHSCNISNFFIVFVGCWCSLILLLQLFLALFSNNYYYY